MYLEDNLGLVTERQVTEFLFQTTGTNLYYVFENNK